MQLIVLFLILIPADYIANIDSASSPLVLFEISITNLHAIIVKATGLGKALYDKLGLSFNAFGNKIKPNVSPRRIAFLVKAYSKYI